MGCEDFNELLTAFLYDEATEVEARRVEAHIERCVECRKELEALREVRGALAAWTAPSFARTRPAWTPPGVFWYAAAAAAVFVGLGAGIGLAGLEVRVGREPLVVAVGRPPVDAGAPPVAVAEALRVEPGPSSPATIIPAAEGDTAALDTRACIEQAEQLLEASEERQVATMRASLDDLERRLVAQRQYDLARISAGLSYLEGKTGQSMARTTELMGQILRVSEGGER